jgi:hypothetical protein
MRDLWELKFLRNGWNCVKKKIGKLGKGNSDGWLKK